MRFKVKGDLWQMPIPMALHRRHLPLQPKVSGWATPMCRPASCPRASTPMAGPLRRAETELVFTDRASVTLTIS